MKYLSLILSALLSLAVQAGDLEEVQQCLRNWKKHPFNSANPDYRVMAARVKVMGIGGEVYDAKPTSVPELVLLKPAVTVMSKSTITLMNPRGWYCLKGRVDVLGKSEINLHCKAHLATSNDGATVLGSNDSDTGVTVLGKSVINRIGCGAAGADSGPAPHDEKPRGKAVDPESDMD